MWRSFFSAFAERFWVWTLQPSLGDQVKPAGDHPNAVLASTAYPWHQDFCSFLDAVIRDGLPRRRALLTVAALAATALSAPGVGAAARLEKSRVQLVVGDKSGFQHLPLTLADQLGFFRQEGLTLEITDAGSPSRALQLMLDGGFDVCGGPYEQTLSLQGRGLFHQSFLVQTRTPQVAFGISTRNLPHFQNLNDLRGKRIGLAQGGSADALVVKHMLARAGLRLQEINLIEVGRSSSAAAALRSGLIDALSHFDPVMTMLEQKGEVKIVADTRTLKGTVDLLGGLLPSSCLYASVDFIQKHPATCQAMTDAMVHALKWLQTAGPGDLIKNVPDPYFQGDRALYLASFSKVRESISPDGLMPPDAARTALRAVAELTPSLAADRIAVNRSFTNDFVRRSKARYRA